jgi:hypothetical protein
MLLTDILSAYPLNPFNRFGVLLVNYQGGTVHVAYTCPFSDCHHVSVNHGIVFRLEDEISKMAQYNEAHLKEIHRVERRYWEG